MTLSLEAGEITIDTWAIQYISPSGHKSNGKLTITNKRLIYIETLGIVSETTGLEMFEQDGKHDLLVIKKTSIKELMVEKNLLSQNAVILLPDGSRHTFNYGSLNIDRLVNAIHDNLP